MLLSVQTSHNRKTALLIIIFLFSAVSIFSQDRSAVLFREAEARFEKGDYLFALQRYQELIDRYPVSEYVADSQFRKAVILYRTGKAEESLALLDRVQRRYGSTRFYRYIPFWKGVVHASLDNNNEAIQSLTQFIGSNPDRFLLEAGQYLALSYKKQGNTGRAADAALSALSSLPAGSYDPYTLSLALSLLLEAGRENEAFRLIEPVDLESFTPQWQKSLSFYKAEALFQSGELQEALPLYRLSLDAGPETASFAYQRLYRIYRELNMREERLDLYDRAIVALARNSDMLNRFLLQVGIEQFKEEEWELSESNLRRVMRTSGESQLSAMATLYISRIYREQGRIDEAINLIEQRERQLGTLDLELLYTVSLLLVDKGHWEDAVRRLETFLARHPLSIHREEAEYLRAFSEYRLGNYRKALDLVNNIFSSGYAGRSNNQLLRLKSRIHTGARDYRAAVDTLVEYIPLAPEDLDARVDLLRLRYQLSEYSMVAEHAEELAAIYPEKRSSIRYLQGLSLVALREYNQAISVFNRMLSPASEADPEIRPHALFYAGWSAYRIADYELAVKHFDEIIRTYPEHDLGVRSLYLLGWAHFARKDFSGAAEAFGEYGQQVAGREADSGIFMYAKSLSAAGDHETASAVFQSLVGQKNSLFSDNALYEYAQLMQISGRENEAIRAYYQLWQQFRNSPFAEEALYRRAELLYLSGRYSEAGDAFFFYRTRYPGGKLLDAGLHYGALASKREEAPYRAVLLWERLLEEHPKSPYYSDALEGLAQIYKELGEYRNAISYYSRLIALYPSLAASVGAEREIETLGRVLQGTDRQEAVLLVTIENEGASTVKGAEAMVELARMYLNRYDRKEEEAVKLLNRVTERGTSYPSLVSEAYYLLGEVEAERDELRKAVDNFLEAAASGGEADTSARALFRAAEVAATSGDIPLAERIVRQIDVAFPGSEWAVRGRALLGRQR
jgi:TolA-binding protein